MMEDGLVCGQPGVCTQSVSSVQLQLSLEETLGAQVNGGSSPCGLRAGVLLCLTA